MPIRILLPENVTPLERYLDRCRQAPGELGPAADLAAVLLLREWEYVQLHTGAGEPAIREPGDRSVWGAFPLTEDGRSALEQALCLVESDTTPAWDLFGVKHEAAGLLAGALPADASGDDMRPLLLQLWLDLQRYDDAASAAKDWAASAPDAIEPLAYLYQCLRADDPATAALAAATERRARPLLRQRRLPPDLSAVVRSIEETLLDRALAVRRRVEPDFGKYLTTERQFYESERGAALAGFDEAEVPADLRGLIPLARELGVGDDPGRGYFINRMTKAARKRAATSIRRHAHAIDAWLTAFDPEALSPTASAFFWLREAGEELEP